MSDSRQHTMYIWVAMIVFTLLAAFTQIFTRSIVIKHDSIFIALCRFIIAAPTLWILVRISGHRIRIDKEDWPRFILLGLLVIPGNQLLFMIGMEFTPAGHAALLYGTTPVWVLLITFLAGYEKLRLWKVGGILLAVMGVIIVLGGKSLHFASEYIRGDLLVLAAVLTWALYTSFSKGMIQKYGPLQATFISIATGTIIFMPFGIMKVFSTGFSALSASDIGIIAYLGFLSSPLAYFIWFWLIKYLRPSQVAVVSCIQTPVTSIFAFIFIGEVLGDTFAWGAIITLIGVAIVINVGGEKMGGLPNNEMTADAS